MSQNAELAGRLAAALSRHLGAATTIRDFARLTGGATKGTYQFTAEHGGKREKLILQLTTVSERMDPSVDATPRLDGTSDARLMIAAAKAGVKVPEVRVILDDGDGMGSGYVTGFVAGQTLGSKLARDPAFAAIGPTMARQAGEALAATHSIDPATLPFLARQDAADQVRIYTNVADHLAPDLPLLAYALRWVAQQVPPPTELTVIHGDFRNGNIIATPERGIEAVIDWEIGQIGDPMQDLGWFCVKTWRFGGKLPAGGFGSREALFEGYEKAGGRTVDPARVRFWEAFGSVRWAVMCLRKGMLYATAEEPISIEQCTIGRRIEEGLYDFLNLIEGRD